MQQEGDNRRVAAEERESEKKQQEEDNRRVAAEDRENEKNKRKTRRKEKRKTRRRKLAIQRRQEQKDLNCGLHSRGEEQKSCRSRTGHGSSHGRVTG